MATKVLMPKLSDTMEEGKIPKWLKKEGDKVEQGEVIAEVESDKADMELEAYDSGILLKISVKEGESAAVGKLIAIIGEKDEDVKELLKEEKSTPKKEEKGESKIKEKTEPERKPSKELLKEEKSTPKKEEKREPKIKEKTEPEKKTRVDENVDGEVKASPLARKMAKEHDIDINEISGSGPDGRIVKRDIEKSLKSEGKQRAATHPVELSGMRKTIARRMTESKTTVPHFYLTVDVDMSRVVEMRNEINGKDSKNKVSFTDIMIKLTALALIKHPKVNSRWTEKGIEHREEVNVGIAVALDDGLITPVVKNCDRKDLLRISKELKELAERARKRKLQPEDYEGGSITVSNLGMYDIESFSAIINPPESAILAVGSIIEKPVVQDGKIVPGKRMSITMSCDHRVIDGAVGAEFLRDLKITFENPLLAL